jgi:hypothetical protein
MDSRLEREIESWNMINVTLQPSRVTPFVAPDTGGTNDSGINSTGRFEKRLLDGGNLSLFSQHSTHQWRLNRTTSIALV